MTTRHTVTKAELIQTNVHAQTRAKSVFSAEGLIIAEPGSLIWLFKLISCCFSSRSPS